MAEKIEEKQGGIDWEEDSGESIRRDSRGFAGIFNFARGNEMR